MDFRRAITFVNDLGNPSNQARLCYVLTGQLPSQKVITQLFADQRGDYPSPSELVNANINRSRELTKHFQRRTLLIQHGQPCL